MNKILNSTVWSVLICGLLILPGCSSPKVSREYDPELSRTASAGRSAFEHGSTEVAARLFIRALARARIMDNSREIANNAYNLAVCEVTLGQYDEARTYLQEAETELTRRGRSLTDVLLMQARVALYQHKGEEARTLTDQVLAQPGVEKNEDYRVQVQLIRARVACDSGDEARANTDLASAVTLLKKVSDPMPHAEASELTARIHLMANEPAKAAPFFDQQAEFLRKGGRYREMALALSRAGDSYYKSGNVKLAADRFYRAARSLFAQGDDLGALQQVKLAVKSAEQTGEKHDVEPIAALFEQIRKHVEEQAPPPAEPKKPSKSPAK